ncbi:Uncharacterised protein [Mycobacteroides abscessus subsp. abscessus]|nr:Uncharacterised protein [Mycobacteroides abscessus subsp. abscessus]
MPRYLSCLSRTRNKGGCLAARRHISRRPSNSRYLVIGSEGAVMTRRTFALAAHTSSHESDIRPPRAGTTAT